MAPSRQIARGGVGGPPAQGPFLPGRRRSQATLDAGVPGRTNGSGGGRSHQSCPGRRRRHRHGCGRFPRGQLHERNSGGAGADNTAGSGRRLGGRQDGREPGVREEPGGRVPSTAGGAYRPGRPGDFERPRVSCRAVRSDQVRRHRESRPVRAPTRPAHGSGGARWRCGRGNDCRERPHKGRSGDSGRARGRSAQDPEFRPHLRARARSGA